jgi:sorbitol/mannitol transport system permease protein
MATQQTRVLGKLAVAPSVLALFLWMIVPLVMTIWFSLLRYNLLDPGNESFAGLLNYRYFLTDPAFFLAMRNSLLLVFAVLIISVVGGTLFALLLDQPIFGRNIVRLMVIAPFFIMPTVSALVWKNMLMHPVSGLFAWIMQSVGLQPIDWFAHYPLTAIIIMVSWAWFPFATLILLTAIQSLDEEQKEAAEMDGTPPLSYFFYIVLPHLARPITVVILIETIFLLNVFAEIYVTGTGGPAGNLPYLVYFQGLLNYDIGGASAGGIVAVVLANIVAFFLVRIVGRNLEG